MTKLTCSFELFVNLYKLFNFRLTCIDIIRYFVSVVVVKMMAYTILLTQSNTIHGNTGCKIKFSQILKNTHILLINHRYCDVI